MASEGWTAVIGTFVANPLLLLYNQRENNIIYHFLRVDLNSHEIFPIKWELLKYSVWS